MVMFNLSCLILLRYYRIRYMEIKCTIKVDATKKKIPILLRRRHRYSDVVAPSYKRETKTHFPFKIFHHTFFLIFNVWMYITIISLKMRTHYIGRFISYFFYLKTSHENFKIRDEFIQIIYFGKSLYNKYNFE